MNAINVELFSLLNSLFFFFSWMFGRYFSLFYFLLTFFLFEFSGSPFMTKKIVIIGTGLQNKLIYSLQPIGTCLVLSMCLVFYCLVYYVFTSVETRLSGEKENNTYQFENITIDYWHKYFVPWIFYFFFHSQNKDYEYHYIILNRFHFYFIYFDDVGSSMLWCLCCAAGVVPGR